MSSDGDRYLDDVHGSRFLKGFPIGLAFLALIVAALAGLAWVGLHLTT